MLSRLATLTAASVLGAVVVCGAQTGPPSPQDAPVAAPGVVASAIAAAEAVTEQPAGRTDGRACDLCPPRRPGKAVIQTTVINGIYGLANLARGQVTARITPKTWWDNMEHGWVWDLDDFAVNQIGHPYQGSNYFNTGRANGLGFYESAAVTAFGSGTWEYFGETNKASLNDFINTTMGGIALGEMFHRVGWLIRDTRATGKARLWSELAATVVDPVTGGNRFLSGDASRVGEPPAELQAPPLGGFVAAGVLWRGNDERAINSTGKPVIEMDLLYGDPTEGRSRTAFDAFIVKLALGGGSAVSEGRIRGRLYGQPFKNDRLQFTVAQGYYYNSNEAYKYGAQSVDAYVGFKSTLSPRTTFLLTGWAGVTVLGAVDSLPADVTAPPVEEEEEGDAGQGVSEGPRYYDYGPGGNFGATASLMRDGRVFLLAFYEGRHLYSLDGVRANHLLQRLRLDLMTPLRGPLGLGATAEYYDRHTFYQDENLTTRKTQYPQFRVYLTWRLS
jgi:hypothetical protein